MQRVLAFGLLLGVSSNKVCAMANGDLPFKKTKKKQT